jgi:hypothetical protein
MASAPDEERDHVARNSKAGKLLPGRKSVVGEPKTLHLWRRAIGYFDG